MRFTNRQILKIAGPILVSVLMEHLIGMTDTAFLGRVGEVELGASALAGVYYLAIFMLGFGFSTGVQIMIGRRNGEGNYTAAARRLEGVVGFIEGFPAGFPVLSLRIRSSGSCTGRAVAEDVPLVVRGGRIPVIVSYRAVA